MEKPKIAQRSPFVEEMEPGTYYWCQCGRSNDQPFCDGSHKGTGFTPIEVKITEAKKVAWCGCKHSNNKPYCDGTHAKLH
ncbi:MAG TPA: CDGSH iron-sulfur domain-containing protein [Nitrospiria bacterium]|nr:CDGSH iron-sulfur domain-containing protein [Nitrospiria bacterium]